MQSEGDGERDRPPQGKRERWGRGSGNDSEEVVTGKGRLKKVSRSKQVTRIFASVYGRLWETYTQICAGFSPDNAV